MNITTRVPEDYSLISDAVSAMCTSGVADSSLSGFYIYIGSGYHSGYFIADVPNSGTMYLIGSGSILFTTDICYVNTDPTGGFVIESLDVINTDESKKLIFVSGGVFTINDSHIIAGTYGFDCPSGKIYFNNIKGRSSEGISNPQYFVSSEDIQLNNTCIAGSLLGSGIVSNNIQSTNSKLLDFNTSILLLPSGSCWLNSTLLKSSTFGVNALDSSTLDIDHCTIVSDTNITGISSIIHFNTSIFSGASCILGTLGSGSYINNSCVSSSDNTWLSGHMGVDPETNNVIYSDPQFNDLAKNDYRLKFKYDGGSPCISLVSLGIPSGVILSAETYNIVFSDERGVLISGFDRFLYKQNNTILFSDYNKEVEFAYFLKNSQYFYDVYSTATFEIYEQNVLSCFYSGGIHPHPYDWDLKTFKSPELVLDKTDLQYVIPRTYIDIESIINSKLSFIGDLDFDYSSISTKNIQVYNKEDTRGISFDHSLSEPGRAVLWLFEGRNQRLIKQDAYSSILLDSYPLLCPPLSGNITTVSGLIYMGQRDNKYLFIDQFTPELEYIAETDRAHFKWIDTSINKQFDLRGVLAYKNNLYLTGTRYSEDIYDRTIVPTITGIGMLLRYSNNHVFTHYIASYNSLLDRAYSLEVSNYLPTDMTIYEDGTLFIADYASISGIFKYQFAYDYAYIRDSYDKLSQVLLREYYPDITF